MKRTLLALAILAAQPPVLSEQSGREATGMRVEGNARFESLVALTEAKMKEFKVPGVAIGILDHGVITARGLGVTNVNDAKPVTAETAFPIASISKTFAATMMMRLVDQGKVDLKAPVRKYLPDFKVRDEHVSREVTVWNLLTHTAGWEGQVSGPERGEDTLRNFTATVMPDLMQVAPPAAAWSYNNAGFSVSGRVIEAVMGKSINRSIEELIFQPLGLKHAGTTAGDFIVHPFAAGHTNGRDGEPGMIRPFSPSVSVTAGGVGLCMDDLLHYAAFHLGNGITMSGDRLLSKSSLELMRTTQLHKQSTDDDIGLAWHLRNVGDLRVAAHGGTLAGHILLLELVPEKDFAIGIFTNSTNGWRLIQDVEREALKSYHGATFTKNYAIAHRGLVETLPNVEPLAKQPDPAAYVGRYLRPMNAVDVRVDGGKLIVQEIPNNGNPRPVMPIAFFGPDRAVITEGNDKGQGIEFVRDAAGAVKWVRVVGRVAGK
ncbi:MAG: beta-lactamase family protein [Cyanobacteria bacterium]|nr:beta-lactamase family protein [Cyanobacteriota bacterium]